MGLESFTKYFDISTSSFFDLFDDKDTIFFVDEPIHCIEKLGAVESEFRESMQGRLEKGYILPGQWQMSYIHRLMSWQGSNKKEQCIFRCLICFLRKLK